MVAAPQDLLDCFDVQDASFGTRALPAFVKRGVEIELARYELQSDVRLNGTHFGYRFRTRYFDATYNFCLVHDSELVASLGFEIDGTAVLIWQLQGKRGARESLRPLKWERALVDYAVHWARGHGFSEVLMASVDNVSWAREHGHLNRDQGRMIYDVTAKRSGFTRGVDGYWSLGLKT